MCWLQGDWRCDQTHTPVLKHHAQFYHYYASNIAPCKHSNKVYIARLFRGCYRGASITDSYEWTVRIQNLRLRLRIFPQCCTSWAIGTLLFSYTHINNHILQETSHLCTAEINDTEYNPSEEAWFLMIDPDFLCDTQMYCERCFKLTSLFFIDTQSLLIWFPYKTLHSN